MGLASILKGDRKRIFELFLTESSLSFSTMEKRLAVRSNLLAYHVEALRKAGVLEKHGEKWRLTQDYERLLPLVSAHSELSFGPVSVVLVLAIKGKRVLLVKREKKPYLGYWSIPGKRLTIDESIPECAARCLAEEAGLSSSFVAIRGVAHERLLENTQSKHAFLFTIVEMEPTSVENTGNTAWFPLSRLPKRKMIPSDVRMIEEFSGKTSSLVEIVMEEKDGKLKGKEFCVIGTDAKA